jgi:hypothetical protein
MSAPPATTRSNAARQSSVVKMIEVGLAGRADGEPAHVLHLRVDPLLHAEHARVEGQRLVLVEDVDEAVREGEFHGRDASSPPPSRLLDFCSVA